MNNIAKGKNYRRGRWGTWVPHKKKCKK